MRYKHYMLIVLMVLWAFNAVDGNALGLVMQSIKADLHLSDTQLGLLTGIAFALFYTIMGIPIARWADRGNRVTILSLTAAVWSLLVALCGTPVNFAQLLLLRVGVGIGEAGCAPAALSLIADYFTRAERPRAVAIFQLGDVLCMFLGLFVAGWLNEMYGWRVMFMILGLPGLVVAALVRFTLKEPRVGRVTAVAGLPETQTTSSAQPSLKEVCVTLWTNTTFRHLLFYFAVGGFFSAGIVTWQSVFLIRSFGLKTGELGTWLGLIIGSSILVGRYGGGELASRLAANNERLQLKAMAIVYCASGIVASCIYLAPNRYWAFGFMWLSFVLANLIVPSTYSLLQTLVAERMRAVSLAIVGFCGALIGSGLGPLAAGALSDALRQSLGEESLRYALLALCPGYGWAAWYLWQGSQTVAGDVQRVQAPPLGIANGSSVLSSEAAVGPSVI